MWTLEGYLFIASHAIMLISLLAQIGYLGRILGFQLYLKHLEHQ